MMCEPDWKSALLGSISLFGALATLPFVPILADKYGRKLLFVAGHLLECLLYTILMFTSSWSIMLAVMGGFGMTTSTRTVIGYTYLTEMFPKNRQVLVVVLCLCEVSLIYMAGTFYFWQIGRASFNFLLVGYVICIVTGIMGLIIPESPRFLLAHGKFEEAKKALDFIAKLNFRPAFDWSKIDLTSAKSDKK